MDNQYTGRELIRLLGQYGDFDGFCESIISPMALREKAQALSFLSDSGNMPAGYMYPVDDAQELLFLMGNSSSGVHFRTRPRLLANCKIAGMDLNRLSDFDPMLLDASSAMRVHCEISGAVMPSGADLRAVDLTGLYAGGTDFSKSKIEAKQLFSLSSIEYAKLPKDLPLGPISGDIAAIAPVIGTLTLTEKNIEGLDLSMTYYPLERLFGNCNRFVGVTFPECDWEPFEQDENGKISRIAYDMRGCSFIRCDLRPISGLSQREVDEASFRECRLPAGLVGRDLEGDYEREFRHPAADESRIHSR